MKIKVAQFRGKNKKSHKIVYMYAEVVKKSKIDTYGKIETFIHCYYTLTYYGYRGWKYRSLEELKNDMKDMYGKWHDFKLLV